MEIDQYISQREREREREREEHIRLEVCIGDK